MQVAKFPRGLLPASGSRLFRIGIAGSIAAGLACGLWFQIASVAGLPAGARTLHVVCGHPSPRLMAALGRAAASGARVQLVTQEEAPRATFPVHRLEKPGTDGILIDGARWMPIPDELR